MKKNRLLVMFLAVVFTFFGLAMTACDTTEGDAIKIRLSEVTHSIFYAPLYIAINNGYFADEGLEIELSNAGGADKVMTALITDAADIGLMGPEATVYVQVGGATNYPMIFGQLTNCDGSFLIGRTPQPDFKWEDLRGKHVLAGRKGGMPAMTLQYVINKAGVSLDEMNFDTSVAFDMMGPAFAGNSQYDYTTLFEPAASTFVAEGKGYYITSVGKDSGAVPYTAFSATKSYLSQNPEVIDSFLKAVMLGREFLYSATDDQIVDALAPSFASTRQEILGAVTSYKAINAWKDSPVMLEEDFDLLQNIMQNAGSLPIKTSFAAVVDNSFAEKFA